MKFSQLSGESCDCGEYGDSSQFLGSFESFFSCEYDKSDHYGESDNCSQLVKYCESGNCVYSNCYFSDKIYENGVRHFINFHFSLFNSKKRSKNGVKTLVWMIALFCT